MILLIQRWLLLALISELNHFCKILKGWSTVSIITTSNRDEIRSLFIKRKRQTCIRCHLKEDFKPTVKVTACDNKWTVSNEELIAETEESSLPPWTFLLHMMFHSGIRRDGPALCDLETSGDERGGEGERLAWLRLQTPPSQKPKPPDIPVKTQSELTWLGWLHPKNSPRDDLVTNKKWPRWRYSLIMSVR